MIGVNPISTPGAYAYAFLAGVRTPGVILKGGVTGWSRPSDWSVKKGKGADGATMTDEGDPPTSGKIKLGIWRNGSRSGDPDDFADWDAFFLMLRAARKSGAALDIQHPLINDLEVRSVVVKNIGQLEEEKGGLWTVTIELQEWVPSPKKAGGTPGGSASKGSGTNTTTGEGSEGSQVPSEDAKTEAEKELDALVDEAFP